MLGGPSGLHIIHGQGQKLSILCLTPYKQSAEENLRVQREDRHLSGQTETLNAAKTTCWILLVWSEPRDGNRIFVNSDNFVNKAKKTNRQVNVSVTKIYSCLPYTIWIDQTHFVLSLCHFWPNEWILCNLFCILRICNFFCGEIKTIAIKRFYDTGIESVGCLFCVLVVATRTIFFVSSDSFWRGAQPDQLPQ